MTNPKTELGNINAMSIGYAVYRSTLRKRHEEFYTEQEKDYWKQIAIPAMEDFPAEVETAQLLKKITSSMTPRAQSSFFNTKVAPSYDELFMVRKFMIRHMISNAIENGAEQIVILRGTYDPRGLITAENNDVTVFELEKGITRKNKLKAIQNIPGKEINQISDEVTLVGENFISIECDFSTASMNELLINSGFDPKKQTFIVAEAATTYETEDTNRKILEGIRQLMQHEKSTSFVGYCEAIICPPGLAKQAHDEHKEKHEFALSQSALLPFVNLHCLSIDAKLCPSDLLKKFNAEASEIYRKGEFPKENYYLMPSSFTQQYNAFEQIPDLAIDLPDIKTKEERVIAQSL